jgi:hypothetical protein
MKEPKDDGKGEAIIKVKTRAERAELMKRFCKITGTTTESGAERILLQMANMQRWTAGGLTEEERVHAGAELIAELGPANATEAFLCVQMFSVHEAALLFLQRATAEGQTFEGADQADAALH